MHKAVSYTHLFYFFLDRDEVPLISDDIFREKGGVMGAKRAPPNPNPCVVFNVRELWYFRDGTNNEVKK